MKALYERAMKGPWKTAGDGLQYRVERTEGGLAALFFQYTMTAQDWQYNVDFLPSIWRGISFLARLIAGTKRPYKDMPVPWRAHRGFVALYRSARDAIMEELQTDLPYALVISGISQGAALAVLAHEDVRFTFPDIDVRTVAFAGPRVFFLPPKALKERLKGVTHVTRRGDIVTMVPPALFGFRHCYSRKFVGKWELPWWTHHRFNEYLEALDGGSTT